MTLHEITPKQLRALLLLLALVPFIPMVLMLRFMADALEGERAAAIERTNSSFSQTLSAAGPSLKKHLATLPRPAEPNDVRKFYRSVFPPEIQIVIADHAGKPVTGNSTPSGRLVAQVSLRSLDLPWQPMLYLTDDATALAELHDQFKVYAWTAAITVIAICSITASAGLTLSSQLTINELKNTSVATVAHELRTPLAAMRILIDTLREGRCRTEEQRREYLDLIASENLRLSRLTDQFLSHSRLERKQHTFQFAPMSPRPIIDAAIAALREKLEAPGCAFLLETTDPLPEIVADRDALVTVLTNLLENALKYTGEAKRITLRAASSGEGLLLAVSDNGFGLSRAERRRIFEPFYQVDQKLSRAREGSGLGLSIVQRIVTAHRGRITVTSEPGKGSQFALTLPTNGSTPH